MENSTSFGDWLRRRRKALDLTQDALAVKVGCSVGLIRKLESDERRPSRQVAELLADGLQIPANERARFIQVARAQGQSEPVADSTGTPSAGSQPLSTEPDAPQLRPLMPSQQKRPETGVSQYTLPTPSTPLIGRDREVGELQHLLANPACRLLTVVGPGGMGKTRLALAAAHQQAAVGQGVAFVALAALTAPAFIVPAIANALGFAFAGASEPKRQLLNYLRAQQLLLVLDNIEHLLEGVELLSELLTHAPALKLLVTSRERLNLQGEWVFDLQGLPVPPGEQSAHLAGYSAAALFLAGAQRVQPGFVVTAQNSAAIAQICRLVEGMPLGLELAAAWMHVLSCQEIAQEIERNLDFLAVSRRDTPERHRSLRATLDHSWKLLTAVEQRALRQLAVFLGGFTREAAVAVAGAALPLLAGLVAKSLVRRSDQRRYDIHELVRQYAAWHLQQDAAEEQATRDRHAAWYLAPLAQREAALQSGAQRAVCDQLTVELDNLRLAWAWAADRGQLALLHQAAPALWYYYWLRLLAEEADAVFQRATASIQRQVVTDEAMRALHEVTLGDLLARWAWFRHRLGHTTAARTLLNQGIALLRRHDDHHALVAALLLLGTLELFQGASAAVGQQIFQECLDLSLPRSQPFQIAMSYSGLGWLAREQGAYAKAQHLLEQALAFYQQAGDPRYIAFMLTHLSRTMQAVGNYAAAEQLLQESLQLVLQNDDRAMLAEVQEVLGQVAYATRDWSQAQQHFTQALALYETLLDRWGVARLLNHLGQLSAAEGHAAAAQQYFHKALQIAAAEKILPNALDALTGLATLQVKQGATAQTLALVCHILNHPATNQESKMQAATLRATIEAQLIPQQIDAIRQQVAAEPFDNVVATLLQG